MAGSPDVVVLPPTNRAARVVDALRSADVDAAALDVEAALARLEAEPPACVVCHAGDDRSAVELLAGVRERRPSVPAVAVGDAGILAGEATRVVDGAGDVEPVVDAVKAALTRGDRDAPEVGDGSGAELADGTAANAAGGSDSLRTERDRFATLVEQLPDPTLVTSLGEEPVVRYVNETFEETFGFDAATARGRTVRDLLVPPDADLVDLRSLDDGEVVQRVVTRLTDEGPREFLLRGSRATIAGREEGFVVYTDVTARRRRADRLNALHEVTRELLAAEDRDEVAAVAVEAAREVLGLPATGVHLRADGERRLDPVAHSEDASALFDGDPPSYGPDSVVWAVFDSGEPRVISDVADASDVEPRGPIRSTMLLPLGDHGVLISSASAPREFSDTEVDLAGLLAANTEAALDDAVNRARLRERERELREERDRLSALFENVPIPAVRVDHRDGEPIVLDVNAEFESTFGYDADDVVGENIDDYLIPDDHDVEPSVKDAASAGETLTREVRRETADGLWDFLLTIAPVDPGTENGQAYGFYIDITERRQRQQRLRVLSRVLRHDIRNRMNVIDGNADLVASRGDDPGVVEPAERIRSAADELLSLSHRTRRIERTVADAADSDPVDVADAVEAVVADVGARFPEATFRVDLPADAVARSAGAFHVALAELLENAVEHSDRDAPRVTVRGETSEDAVVVRVLDDGPGIPERERELVDGTREPTQLEHASGIGLWMVKWVATALGGDVFIEDRDPRGTEVALWLPRVDES